MQTGFFCPAGIFLRRGPGKATLPRYRQRSGTLKMESVLVHNHRMLRNGFPLAGAGDAAAFYHALGCSYPKFFKMDSLCKWAWIGVEALLRKPEGGWHYDGLDKKCIAVALATRDGCLEVDHRFSESIGHIASPALFVYTLPNIMLGEICIRHGFTGEQLCLAQEAFEREELLFWARDACRHREATHCLFGWVNANADDCEMELFWSDAAGLENLDSAQLQSIHNQAM